MDISLMVVINKIFAHWGLVSVIMFKKERS